MKHRAANRRRLRPCRYCRRWLRRDRRAPNQAACGEPDCQKSRQRDSERKSRGASAVSLSTAELVRKLESLELLSSEPIAAGLLNARRCKVISPLLLVVLGLIERVLPAPARKEMASAVEDCYQRGCKILKETMPL